MTNEEIVQRLKERLNEEGKQFHLKFEVSSRWKEDGAWTQFFIHSNEDRSNSAAARQIVSNVETEITNQSGKELLLVPLPEIIDAA